MYPFASESYTFVRTKSVLVLGEHRLDCLPDEARHKGEHDGVRHGGGGPGSGEVEENSGDERVEENGREKKLGPHGLFSQPKISWKTCRSLSSRVSIKINTAYKNTI